MITSKVAYDFRDPDGMNIGAFYSTPVEAIDSKEYDIIQIGAGTSGTGFNEGASETADALNLLALDQGHIMFTQHLHDAKVPRSQLWDALGPSWWHKVTGGKGLAHGEIIMRVLEGRLLALGHDIEEVRTIFNDYLARSRADEPHPYGQLALFHTLLNRISAKPSPTARSQDNHVFTPMQDLARMAIQGRIDLVEGFHVLKVEDAGGSARVYGECQGKPVILEARYVILGGGASGTLNIINRSFPDLLPKNLRYTDHWRDDFEASCSAEALGLTGGPTDIGNATVFTRGKAEQEYESHVYVRASVADKDVLESLPSSDGMSINNVAPDRILFRIGTVAETGVLHGDRDRMAQGDWAPVTEIPDQSIINRKAAFDEGVRIIEELGLADSFTARRRKLGTNHHEGGYLRCGHEIDQYGRLILRSGLSRIVALPPALWFDTKGLGPGSCNPLLPILASSRWAGRQIAKLVLAEKQQSAEPRALVAAGV